MKGQHIAIAERNALKRGFRDGFSLIRRIIESLLREGSLMFVGWFHG